MPNPHLQDPTILGPIAFLGPDFTVEEWAQRLGVSQSEVLLAFEILNTKPRLDFAPTLLVERKAAQAEDLIQAIRKGHHRTAEIASFVGLPETSTRAKLNWLCSMGVIWRTRRSGKGNRWLLKDKIV